MEKFLAWLIVIATVIGVIAFCAVNPELLLVLGGTALVAGDC